MDFTGRALWGLLLLALLLGVCAGDEAHRERRQVTKKTTTTKPPVCEKVKFDTTLKTCCKTGYLQHFNPKALAKCSSDKNLHKYADTFLINTFPGGNWLHKKHCWFYIHIHVFVISPWPHYVCIVICYWDWWWFNMMAPCAPAKFAKCTFQQHGLIDSATGSIDFDAVANHYISTQKNSAWTPVLNATADALKAEFLRIPANQTQLQCKNGKAFETVDIGPLLVMQTMQAAFIKGCPVIDTGKTTGPKCNMTLTQFEYCTGEQLFVGMEQP